MSRPASVETAFCLRKVVREYGTGMPMSYHSLTVAGLVTVGDVVKAFTAPSAIVSKVLKGLFSKRLDFHIVCRELTAVVAENVTVFPMFLLRPVTGALL